MRAEIKVVETKKRYKRSIKLKVAVLGNINKTEKPLAALKKKNSNKIRNERGSIITDTTEIQ